MARNKRTRASANETEPVARRGGGSSLITEDSSDEDVLEHVRARKDQNDYSGTLASALETETDPKRRQVIMAKLRGSLEINPET